MAERLSICIVGSGAWGTALASVLDEGGHDVLLWAREPEVVETINTQHENTLYLPGVNLAPSLRATSDLAAAVRDHQLIVSVCPSQYLREVTAVWAPHARTDAMIVSASKGIETGTRLLMSQVLDEVLPDPLKARVAYLSGPSFAREVAQGLPTVVVIGAEDESFAERIQRIFARPTFRTYRSTDVIGVEVGGALKNVFAIATGICDGMSLGYNARAALITRGLLELTRMAVKLGADPITMMGLAGMGDLVLTCTTDLSRNRTVGKAIGSGRNLDEILGGMPQVVEGVATSQSAHNLAKTLGVDTPIIDEIHAVLYEGASVPGAVERLMTRELKREEV